MASLMDLIAGYSLPNGLLNMNYKTRNRAGQPVQPSTDTITNAITQGLLPMLASAGIGTGAGIAGQFGEAENLGKLAINKLGGNVNPNTTLPTQEGILSYLNSITPLKPYTDNTYTKIGANLLAPILDPMALTVGAKHIKDMPIGNMMIGPESALWDKQMAFEAAKLKKANKSPQEIYEKTGVSTGLDKNFRQEISDESSFLKGGPTFNDVVMNRMAALKIDKPTVKDIFYHPQLMEAYPELGNIEIQFIKKGDSANASYSPSENIIRVNGNLKTKKANNSLLHELQHAIQEKEGWAKGADANAYLRKYQKMQNELDERLSQANQALKKYVGTPDYERELKHRNQISQEYMDFVGQDMMGAYHKAKDEYMKVAGEAEARLTQNREKMSMKQRKEVYPYAEGKNAMDMNPNDVIYNDVFSNLINGK